MRRFVVGDIHGAHKALVQVLERSNFDYENDLLITIGDIVDGWEDSFNVVEELLKIENRIDIRGNHDETFNDWINTCVHNFDWELGSLATAASYARAAGFELKSIAKADGEGHLINLNVDDVPDSHKDFFRKQVLYYKDECDNLFVHAGFNINTTLKDNYEHTFMWDRYLWKRAMEIKDTLLSFSYEEDFNEIFIGHTATQKYGSDKPIKADKIWNVDTGAGGGDGKLTIMNIDTSEYYQSDPVSTLYPNDKQRNYGK